MCTCLDGSRTRTLTTLIIIGSTSLQRLYVHMYVRSAYIHLGDTNYYWERMFPTAVRLYVHMYVRGAYIHPDDTNYYN